MATKSKPVQNKHTPTAGGPTKQEVPRSPARKETTTDLFIVHEGGNRSVTESPLPDTRFGTSLESARETEYSYHKILFENRVAEIAARIAHEFNHPLATVLVYTQLLLSMDNLDEITKQSLAVIYREAQHASLLTTSLFFYARRDKPDKRFISIQEVIQKALEHHIPRLRGSNIEVIVKLQPDIPRTMADPYQIKQMIANIIVNAEQAMLEAHGKGTLCIKAQTSNEMIQITFEDDGPGIPQQYLQRIFDPFFTTKDLGKGLGLGLSICSNIVESHDGHMYAISEPGKGAAIVIELPIVAQ